AERAIAPVTFMRKKVSILGTSFSRNKTRNIGYSLCNFRALCASERTHAKPFPGGHTRFVPRRRPSLGQGAHVQLSRRAQRAFSRPLRPRRPGGQSMAFRDKLSTFLESRPQVANALPKECPCSPRTLRPLRRPTAPPRRAPARPCPSIPPR